jgi:pimeloyl-ACP methyl ester carboxylesterase
MIGKLTKFILGFVVLSAVILVIWYQIDGIPIPETDTYLAGRNFTAVEETDGSLIYTPANSNGYGIMIMHGALILPKSYTKSAAYFASRGYTVYLPKGLGRMSIAAVNSSAIRADQMNVKQWFLIGHSMGGMAVLEIAATHNLQIAAVALWATSMPSDYSKLDIPILFIWGDADGLLPAERFINAQHNLPNTVEYVTLKGANHKNFALYSHQFFDGEASIDWAQQINFANETTHAFFNRYRR